jgi:hypothetical protein
LYDGSSERKGQFQRSVTQKNMGHRITVGIAVVAALACAGGAFYWLHGRNERPKHGLALGSMTLPPVKAAESKSIATAGENARTPEAKKIAADTDMGLPLRAGEVLEFTAHVAKLNNVANLRLLVSDRRSFLGKNAWHLQAFAHTENPLRMVFELDDQFDSYSDAGTMASLQYEMHLSERGQKVDSVQRMTATGKEPAPAEATEVRVLPGTRDPLGMMQYLRNVDWAKTLEVRSPVYDGHKLYDVRAKFAGPGGTVSVPAGNFRTSKVELRVFDNGAEMKDAHFALYLANTEARTPVLLEAVLPFATARVELVKAK